MLAKHGNMRILPLGLLLTTVAFAQKKFPNPKIGKNETEINLFSSSDQGYSGTEKILLGCEAIYRVPWGKATKLGGGILLGADKYVNWFEEPTNFYGALFADITQFIGRRQLWGIDGRIGHGIYKDKFEIDDSLVKGFTKWTGGLYYSVGLAYRVVVSKKIIVGASVYFAIRNLRRTSVADYFNPPSQERYKQVEHYSRYGFRFGIVF